MAELFPSAILSVLFEKLTSLERLEFATEAGVRSKLKKWEKMLQMIKALLNDVEQKQLDDKAVKKWLEELQDLAHDAEGILDEYATEASRRKLKIQGHQASTSWARKLIPAGCISRTPSALWSDIHMRSKIDDITSRLQDLCHQRTQLGLVEIAGGRSAASQQRLPTTCLPTETVVYGREDDKAKILEMVLTNEPGVANFDVIPIVRMGGIGKTTLAWQVYNDKKLEIFNTKAWLCVSDNFDVLRISKAILECFTGTSCAMKELSAVQNQLKHALNGKRFLIVLDDVWSKDNDSWDRLKAPFLAGAPGSKFIVTTRGDDDTNGGDDDNNGGGGSKNNKKGNHDDGDDDVDANGDKDKRGHDHGGGEMNMNFKGEVMFNYRFKYNAGNENGYPIGQLRCIQEVQSLKSKSLFDRAVMIC